ncbi:hypothetical protein NA56DRAFT_747427 [Hyaloscypha hepaticicola]|uniref:Methyltransferase domain-containing protein n=1 Tax=Hyaloscypha hepaticicola TaxID=2082293 RepID=A0A2J6Q964_9HELO|nr:hypothetical protein NA56DRAFT_747427 [Hyaloscypha hepaticicola]
MSFTLSSRSNDLSLNHDRTARLLPFISNRDDVLLVGNRQGPSPSPKDFPDFQERLNRQHRLWTKTLNYLIHPVTLSSLTSNAHIAELATGNGIWLLSVARTLPEIQLVGFDISKNQFPDPDADGVPKNVSFEAQDPLQPFPHEYLGTFDMVSVRMVASTPASNEWESFARNISSLLRGGGLEEGGYIQWSEPNTSTPPISQNTSQAHCTSLTTLSHTSLTYLSTHNSSPHLCLHLPHLLSLIPLSSTQKDILAATGTPLFTQNSQTYNTCQVPTFSITASRTGTVEFGAGEELGMEGVCAAGRWGRCDFYVVVGRKGFCSTPPSEK